MIILKGAGRDNDLSCALFVDCERSQSVPMKGISRMININLNFIHGKSLLPHLQYFGMQGRRIRHLDEYKREINIHED